MISLRNVEKSFDHGPTRTWVLRRVNLDIASGEFVYAAGLADPTHTQWVAPSQDGALVTDGPYAETKEHLMSFGIVDVVDNERALEIAAQMATVFGRVEVRPIDDAGVGDV